MESEILVDDSLEEYQEPALTELDSFNSFNVTDISVDLGPKSEDTEQVEDRKHLQSPKDYFRYWKDRLFSKNDKEYGA